jgi:AcrR family transcriptional regulator
MRGIGGRSIQLEDKRERLLDASERAFCRLGYARTTMAALAEEADVTRPTVYSYFPSKDEVFLALADRVRREFLALQEQAVSGCPLDTIKAALYAYLQAFTRHRDMLTVIAHEALTDPAMGALLEDIFNQANRRNTRFVESLATAGLVSPLVEPAVLSEALTGIVARFAEQAAARPERQSSLASDLLELYLGMVRFRDGVIDGR